MAGINMNMTLPTRLCEVKGELGYFHLWEQWSNVVDASPLRGGHPGGQPASIKFCDEENATLCSLVKHNEEMRKGENHEP